MSKRVRPQDWTWREVAAWIDTEGSLDIVGLEIAQIDRSPLVTLKAFLESKGYKVSLYPARKKPYVHILSIQGHRAIRRLVERTKRFLRTKKKREKAEEIVHRPLLPPRRPPKFTFPFDAKRKRK